MAPPSAIHTTPAAAARPSAVPLLARNAVRQLEKKSLGSAGSIANSHAGAASTSTALGASSMGVPAAATATTAAVGMMVDPAAERLRNISLRDVSTSMDIDDPAGGRCSETQRGLCDPMEISRSNSTSGISACDTGGTGGSTLSMVNNDSLSSVHRLGVPGAGSGPARALSVTSAHGSATPPINPGRLIEQEKLRILEPRDLLAHLRAGGGQCVSPALDVAAAQKPVPGASSAWSQPMSILLIDLRPAPDFERVCIPKSVSATFPALLIKRFKRRAVSNFNLNNFIAGGNDSRAAYSEWQQVALADKAGAVQSVVVVLDETMNMGNTESEAWALAAALAEGMAADLIKYGPDATDKSRPIVTAFLRGGMRALLETPESSAFALHRQPESADPSAGGGMGSASGCNGSLDPSDPSGKVKRLSISVGGEGSAGGLRPAKPRPSMKIKNPGAGGDDGAAPASPVVTANPSGPPAPLNMKKSKLGLAIDTQSPVRTTFKSSKSSLAVGSLASPVVTVNTGKQALLMPGAVGAARSGLSQACDAGDTSPVTAIRLNMGDLPLPGQRDDTNMSPEESPTTSPNDNAAPPEPCSRISPNIFVGSDAIPLAPDAIEQLQRLGVTHILNMAAEIKNSQAVIDSGKFVHKWLPVHDNTEQDMDAPLKEAIDFISSAISSNPNAVVFVHCKAGRSRSVSVVIGYLVSTRRYTLKTAYELVRRVRKGVSPNLGFMAALMKVEKDAYGENSQITQLYG
nr:Dual specificity protein phosphatase 9 [Polyrhizophydium stewartii]